MIVDVHQPRKVQLAVIAQALRLQGLRFGLAERGQEHPSQDGDDRDDDQQLDEGEGFA